MGIVRAQDLLVQAGIDIKVQAIAQIDMVPIEARVGTDFEKEMIPVHVPLRIVPKDNDRHEEIEDEPDLAAVTDQHTEEEHRVHLHREDRQDDVLHRPHRPRHLLHHKAVDLVEIIADESPLPLPHLNHDSKQ
jgi:hypothetical protein